MRIAVAKLTFIILTFNVTFVNNLHGDIKRREVKEEDALFKTRPKPRVNAQLRWIIYF